MYIPFKYARFVLYLYFFDLMKQEEKGWWKVTKFAWDLMFLGNIPIQRYKKNRRRYV